MFQYVNEIAVFGTTFFMMALATLWYSEYIFQKAWLTSLKRTKIDVVSDVQHIQKSIGVMFCTYLIAVYVIAVVVGYARVYGFPVEKIAGLMVLGFAALVIGLLVWERRPLMYYGITLGFGTVFIVGSSFLLYHWPW